MPELSRGSGPPARLASASKRAAVLVLLSVGFAALASSDALHEMVVRVVTAAEAIILAHPRWGISLFILLSALASMLAFLSTTAIAPVAVQTWGEPLSIFFLWSGWLLGGMCAYVVGRVLGRPVMRSLTSSVALARFEHRFSAHAPFGLVLLFQLAVPSEVPGYVLGLARYRFAKYVVALAIAELPFAVATVFLGVSFLERRTLLLLAIGVAGALVSALAFYALQKRLSE